MRRPFSQFQPVMGLLAWSTLAVLPSCGANSSSTSADKATQSSDEKPLFLLGALAVDSTECVAKTDATAKLLGQGVLDLAFTSSYTAMLAVGSQFAQPDAASETERVSLRSAAITLTTADGAVLEQYSTVGTGFIDAATASAAYGPMAVTVIPAALGLTKPVQSAQLLVAKIRVLGEALNGTTLTSSEMDLPIRVCTGCLVQYPASAADTTPPAGSSYLCTTADVGLVAASAPCVLGQDVPFSCVLCSTTHALCRDPRLNPAVSP